MSSRFRCYPLSVRTNDISGTGVRVAIYIQLFTQIILQTFIVFKQPFRDRYADGFDSSATPAQNERGEADERERAMRSHWVLIGLSIGLTTAGLVTGIQRQITLLDAAILANLIQVSDLFPGLLETSLFYTQPYVTFLQENPRQAPPLFRWGFAITAFYWLGSASAIGFGFWVWITAATFGSAPECNEYTTLVFGFGSFKSDPGGFNSLLILGWSISAAAFLWRNLITLRNATMYMKVRALAGLTPEQRESHLKGLGLSREWLEKQKPSKRSVVIRYIYFLAVVFSMVAWTELLLRYNPTQTEEPDQIWTFGQILPLTLAVLEFCVAIPAVLREIMKWSLKGLEERRYTRTSWYFVA